MKPSTSITVVMVFCFLWAAIFFVPTVAFVIFFIQSEESPKNWGEFFLLVGTFALFAWIPLVLGFGLRRRKGWARISVIILAALGIFSGLGVGLGGAILVSLVVFSVSVWTLWSMSRRRVKQAFEETKAVEKEIRQA
jgi:hypothetical protein